MDGRPNRRNKTAFSNSFGVVWPKTQSQRFQLLRVEERFRKVPFSVRKPRMQLLYDNSNNRRALLECLKCHFSVCCDTVKLAASSTLRREKFENAALFLRLSPPSKLIRHENGAFRKRSSSWRNLKTPASRFSVDRKHFAG